MKTIHLGESITGLDKRGSEDRAHRELAFKLISFLRIEVTDARSLEEVSYQSVAALFRLRTLFPIATP